MARMNTMNDVLAQGLTPLKVLWFQFIAVVPQLIGAAIIVALGWVAAVFVGRLTTRVVASTGVDTLVQRSGLNTQLKLSDGSRYALLSGMVGTIVQWLIILATLGIAADALNMPQVSQFVGQIFAYVPNIIVAVIVLTVGIIGSQFAANIVRSGVGQFPGNRETIASVVRYAILTFSVMAALTQLRIVPNLIEILFAGLVFGLALAFGLGGRDHARDAIARMREGAPATQ